DAAGGTYKVTFLSFYVGNFRLVDASGGQHPASLVDATDTPLPYGLQLINVDDTTTEQLRLAVAPGSYQSLLFSVGVDQACDAIPLADRSWPLTIETEMNWGWTMLHLRLEGLHNSSLGNFSLLYHLGFPEQYRSVQVASALDLSQGPLQRTLALAVDQLIGADTPAVIASDDQVTDNLAAPGTFSLR
ncbi:MAG TPA: MbnP family protein, partial [Polyangiaceae bacterium]|nr:MbnP family protein [Polyangiaceae bacterium]